MSDTVSIKMNDDCPTGRNCLFSEKLFELSDEITRLRAENERLQAMIDDYREKVFEQTGTIAKLGGELSMKDAGYVSIRDENARLHSENEKLREALKPFIVVLFNDEVEDLSTGKLYGWVFEKEHLRRARAALKGE